MYPTFIFEVLLGLLEQSPNKQKYPDNTIFLIVLAFVMGYLYALISQTASSISRF
ncbi:MAG: hypothetical protein R2880_03825 [Deinococcales bacterium]